MSSVTQLVERALLCRTLLRISWQAFPGRYAEHHATATRPLNSQQGAGRAEPPSRRLRFVEEQATATRLAVAKEADPNSMVPFVARSRLLLVAQRSAHRSISWPWHTEGDVILEQIAGTVGADKDRELVEIDGVSAP